jgi:hypothetical protein
VISLAAGSYGKVSVSSRNYASNVTIKAASATDPAHLDGLFVSKSSNISFSGLDLGRAAPADNPSWIQLNWIKDSSNIHLKNVHVHGSGDDDPTNDGIGVFIGRSTGVKVENSTFSDLYRGVAIQQSNATTVLSNYFETIRSDGVVAAAVNGLIVDGNSFTDFQPVLGDHADGIQLWNTGQTVGSSNVTIRNNVIAPGPFNGVEAQGVQGIFISNPGTLGYKNVNIQNNLIYTHGAWNGIMARGVSDLKIVKNTLLSQDDDSQEVWIRAEDSNTVTIQGNVAEDMALKNLTALVQSSNIDLSVTPTKRDLIPDPESPDTLKDLIIASYGFQLPASTTAAYATAVGDASDFYAPLTMTVAGFNLESFLALP